MENVLFFFANLPVYSYGFMLGLGLVVGSILAQREGKRKGLGTELIFKFIVQVALVFTIVGRLGVVFPLYGWRTLLYPWTLFSSLQLNETTGLIAVGVYTIYFLIRHVNNPASFLDVLVPSAALMQSLACLGSSILGRETTSSWGVDLGEFVLHPLPLYTALAYYVLFLLLWKNRRNLRYDGQLFLGYLALSAGVQRLLLPYREILGDSTNPWLYTMAAFLFGFAWLYIYVSSPLTDSRRRRSFGDWRYWLVYLASIVVVSLIMIKFFYWRFS